MAIQDGDPMSSPIGKIRYLTFSQILSKICHFKQKVRICTMYYSLQDSYSVMRLKDDSSARSLQKRASDFVQSRFYGPGTRRTTSKNDIFCLTSFLTKFISS